MERPPNWTDEAVEKLRSMVEQKLTCSEIAKELGVTRNAIIGKCHRLLIDLGGRKQKAKPKIRDVRYKLKRKLERQNKPDLDSCPIEVRRISLVDLDIFSCRYVLDDKDENNIPMFCGNLAPSGKYCVGHARVIYREVRR